MVDWNFTLIRPCCLVDVQSAYLPSLFNVSPQTVTDWARPRAHGIWSKDDSGCEAEGVSWYWSWHTSLLQKHLPSFLRWHLWDSGTDTWRHCQSKFTFSLCLSRSDWLSQVSSFYIDAITLHSVPRKWLKQAAHASVIWPTRCTRLSWHWNMLMRLEACLSTPSTTCSSTWALSCMSAWLPWNISPVDVWGAGQFHQTRSRKPFILYTHLNNMYKYFRCTDHNKERTTSAWAVRGGNDYKKNLKEWIFL